MYIKNYMCVYIYMNIDILRKPVLFMQWNNRAYDRDF